VTGNKRQQGLSPEGKMEGNFFAGSDKSPPSKGPSITPAPQQKPITLKPENRKKKQSIWWKNDGKNSKTGGNTISTFGLVGLIRDLPHVRLRHAHVS